MSKLDVSKASRETLERLASATHEWAGDFPEQPGYAGESKELCRALVVFRAECDVRSRLRTRAEVDVDLASILRENTETTKALCGVMLDMRDTTRAKLLCAEPTAEPDLDLGQFEVDPDPAEHVCSCGEAGKLKERIAELEQQLTDRTGNYEHWREVAEHRGTVLRNVQVAMKEAPK
jgi:hypothetical protein